MSMDNWASSSSLGRPVDDIYSGLYIMEFVALLASVNGRESFLQKFSNFPYRDQAGRRRLGYCCCFLSTEFSIDQL